MLIFFRVKDKLSETVIQYRLLIIWQSPAGIKFISDKSLKSSSKNVIIGVIFGPFFLYSKVDTGDVTGNERRDEGMTCNNWTYFWVSLSLTACLPYFYCQISNYIFFVVFQPKYWFFYNKSCCCECLIYCERYVQVHWDLHLSTESLKLR